MSSKHKTPYTFVRIATISPRLSIGDVQKNIIICLESIKNAYFEGARLIVLPELALTGYTAGDLFLNESLHKDVAEGLEKLSEELRDIEATIVVGAPIRTVRGIINAAVIYTNGKIVGVVPKLHLPNYKEFYEKRWFISGFETHENTIKINNEDIPYGRSLLFSDTTNEQITFGIDICEDGWMPIPPSTLHALNGATILLNLSASNELVGKAAYRKNLSIMQSAKTISAYAYVSSGVDESTTDVVFSGHSIIAENGIMISESPRFKRETVITYADIDIDHLVTERNRTNSFADNQYSVENQKYQKIPVNIQSVKDLPLKRTVSKTPFLPDNKAEQIEVVDDIFNIQVTGLAKRLESSGVKKMVIGLSGGLDSTLAFLVCLKTCEALNLPKENIVAITMPGFGTTSGTKNNAVILAESTGVTLEEISISDGVLQHFKDIGHDPKNEDVVFENSQARYRTMILMDKANQVGGMVIGTGDLSESALGWCTFNGDQMAHYNVNGSIPKTLVQYIVRHVAEMSDEKLKKVLIDILETPISPELTRMTDDVVTQKTEDVVGPYILHDFFLYHLVRWGSSPQKILALATIAFEGDFSEDVIKKWLKSFISRFFKNQWKRSVMPDGPKVGSVSLSPRGDWRMPSDALADTWLKEL